MVTTKSYTKICVIGKMKYVAVPRLQLKQIRRKKKSETVYQHHAAEQSTMYTRTHNRRRRDINRPVLILIITKYYAYG